MLRLGTMKIKIIIQTQTREWYGDDAGPESGKGRFKCKGGQDFVVEVDEMLFMYERERLEALFNERMNNPSDWFRYEWIDAELYHAPQALTFEDGSGFDYAE